LELGPPCASQEGRGPGDLPQRLVGEPDEVVRPRARHRPADRPDEVHPDAGVAARDHRRAEGPRRVHGRSGYRPVLSQYVFVTNSTIQAHTHKNREAQAYSVTSYSTLQRARLAGRLLRLQAQQAHQSAKDGCSCNVKHLEFSAIVLKCLERTEATVLVCAARAFRRRS
jgi:hypothetical protein